MRTVTRPNSFIFTLYGDFVHRRDQPEAALWIGSLVKLMASFGLSEPAVRQAISRMTRSGWLVAEKRGARGYYRVTERGRRRIEGLSPRIYGPVVEWDGRWRMLAYTVPEENRTARDRLRKDLTVLGWAPLGASIWISPTDSLADAREAVEANGLLDGIDTFVADNSGPHSDRELLERCWDIGAIAHAYDEFVARYRARLERESSQHALSDEDAFVERLWLVHDYRKFTYLDPGLPSTLLPAHWPGAEAARLFRYYYAAIEAKSERFFAGALAT